MNKYTLIGLLLAILLTITIISAGLTNSAYAHGSKVKVGCKDLAIDLISWDELYKYIDIDDLIDIEDAFWNDNLVDPSSFDDIIDEHMEELLDDFEIANCKHLDDDLEDWIDDKVDFERN